LHDLLGLLAVLDAVRAENDVELFVEERKTSCIDKLYPSRFSQRAPSVLVCKMIVNECIGSWMWVVT
jgi:hypothetical protein